MTQDGDKQEKVVNLADARKRQRTTQEKPRRKAGATGYDKALAKQRGAPGGGSSRTPMSIGKRLAAVAQLIVFLAICYALMQTCSGH